MSTCPSTAIAAAPPSEMPENHHRSHTRLAVVQRADRKSRRVQLPVNKRYAYQLVGQPLVRRDTPRNSDHS